MVEGAYEPPLTGLPPPPPPNVPIPPPTATGDPLLLPRMYFPATDRKKSRPPSMCKIKIASSASLGCAVEHFFEFLSAQVDHGSFFFLAIHSGLYNEKTRQSAGRLS